jgi:hypothetical protein
MSRKTVQKPLLTASVGWRNEEVTCRYVRRPADGWV